jgi:hypothetical protein
MRLARHVHIRGRAEIQAGFCFGNVKERGEEEDIRLYRG